MWAWQVKANMMMDSAGKVLKDGDLVRVRVSVRVRVRMRVRVRVRVRVRARARARVRVRVRVRVRADGSPRSSRPRTCHAPPTAASEERPDGAHLVRLG